MPRGIFKRVSRIEKFLSKICIKDDGCWDWLGSGVNTGYGKFWDGNRLVFVHRYSYEWFNNVKLPEYDCVNYEIDHLCRNRKCVNPDHLELVTHKINVQRGSASEVNSLRNKAITQCIHGHPFNKNNTYIRKNGERMCKTCRRENMRRYKVEERRVV
jgi:hypothetical protein